MLPPPRNCVYLFVFDVLKDCSSACEMRCMLYDGVILEEFSDYWNYKDLSGSLGRSLI